MILTISHPSVLLSCAATSLQFLQAWAKQGLPRLWGGGGGGRGAFAHLYLGVAAARGVYNCFSWEANSLSYSPEILHV